MHLLHGRHGLAALSLIAVTTPVPSLAQELAKPTTDMQAVLDKLGALEAKPVSTLIVPEVRTHASSVDAGKDVQGDKRQLATYAKGGDDEAVRAFAAKTLPKLEMQNTHVMHLVASH